MSLALAAAPARLRPWGVYAVLAALGLVLRVPLAFYNQAAGYEALDTTLINIDGVGYVRKAVGLQESYADLNWLYESLNTLMFRLGGSERYLYLQMSLLNVVLSLLLPLAAWPAFRWLVDDAQARDRARIAMTALLLLWPPAIWMSAQNMKDTLLALLLCAYTSAAIALLARGGRAPLAWVAALLSAFALFSLRVYAIAILGVATAIAALATWRRHPRLVLVGGLVAIGALAGPLRAPIETILSPENRFLFDPTVVAAINEQRLTQDEAFLQVNSTLPDIARDAVRAPLNPYPSLYWRNGYDGLLMLRTVAAGLGLGGFLLWLVRWRSPYRAYFVGALVLAWAFFAVGRSYSGPRQVYSTIEPPMLMAVAVALATERRQAYWLRSAAAGATVLLVLLAYTTLTDYAAAP
ncbi:MAG: hypothetical protein MUF21_00570 [Gemmatimonadaceae bacterium]|nr:hypothetical protein [Gemmatimonadaceae bacterium]